MSLIPLSTCTTYKVEFVALVEEKAGGKIAAFLSQKRLV